MEQEMLEEVRRIFENDFSGHDFFHTKRVMKTASFLAGKEKADPEITMMGALLHDVDDYKLTGKVHDHTNAIQIMAEHHVSKSDQKRITHIIDQVSFAGNESVIPDTIEGKCVQDADRLDALGAIGIARAFAWGGSHERKMYDPAEKPEMDMNAEEYRRHKGTTINHFYEKLLCLKDLMNTETGRKLAAERTAYMESFLKEFKEETEGWK